MSARTSTDRCLKCGLNYTVNRITIANMIANVNTYKTSLKADKEDWGWGGGGF